MLERKFKKLVESYPNLVDGRFAISKAKAEEIIAEKGGHASLEEIVDRAKKRSDLPDSEWEPFDRLIEKEQAAANRRSPSVVWALGGMRRGIVILMALIVFITLFFIVTPTGRTWAKQLYSFILTVHADIPYLPRFLMIFLRLIMRKSITAVMRSSKRIPDIKHTSSKTRWSCPLRILWQ